MDPNWLSILGTVFTALGIHVFTHQQQHLCVFLYMFCMTVGWLIQSVSRLLKASKSRARSKPLFVSFLPELPRTTCSVRDDEAGCCEGGAARRARTHVAGTHQQCE